MKKLIALFLLVAGSVMAQPYSPQSLGVNLWLLAPNEAGILTNCYVAQFNENYAITNTRAVNLNNLHVPTNIVGVARYNTANLLTNVPVAQYNTLLRMTNVFLSFLQVTNNVNTDALPTANVLIAGNPSTTTNLLQIANGIITNVVLNYCTP